MVEFTVTVSRSVRVSMCATGLGGFHMTNLLLTAQKSVKFITKNRTGSINEGEKNANHSNMPLNQTSDSGDPASLTDVQEDFMIFYSSRDESGSLWCPVRRLVRAVDWYTLLSLFYILIIVAPVLIGLQGR